MQDDVRPGGVELVDGDEVNGPDHGEGARRSALHIAQRLQVRGEARAEDEHALGADDGQLLERLGRADVAVDGLIILIPQRLDPGVVLVDDEEILLELRQLLRDGEADAAPAQDDVGVALALRRRGELQFALVFRRLSPGGNGADTMSEALP